MCHHVITTALVITLLTELGCQAYITSLQSPFFTQFSLRKLFETNEFSAGLDCSQGPGGGGGGGMAMGGAGMGKEQSRFNRIESVACQITNTELFDEANFLQALKGSIEKDLGANAATIVSSKNSDPRSFSVDYAISSVTGTISISATRGPARFYTLQANLDETRNTK